MTTRKQTRNVSIVWAGAPAQGRVEVFHGRLAGLRVVAGKGTTAGAGFRLAAAEPARLEVRVAEARVGTGAQATRVMIHAAARSFSFFLRDVTALRPILVSEYGVAVVPAADRRDYGQIRAAIEAQGLASAQDSFEAAPEETFENACRENRDQMCPTWLGLGRDMRFFEVGYDPNCGYWGYVQPRYHSTPSACPESNDKPYNVGFVFGPGASCRYRIERRLDEGTLPILTATQYEDDVHYHLTSFCTLEKGPVSAARLRGSDWRACYPNTGGNMISKEDRDAIQGLIETEMHRREEETVCVVHVEAVNTGRVPRYAWFKASVFQPTSRGWGAAREERYDGSRGFLNLKTDRVLAVNRMNGRPMPQEEMAVLLQPGETQVFDVLIPHQPLSQERAVKLARLDVARHLAAARAFWRKKLAVGATIQVPEAAIDERIRAGLLHCDVATLGKDPGGTLLATIGWYSPIGSESSPIIQFFDSMGWHDVAERALQFFLDRQRKDGFIQNFGGYQLETGPALWSMGEHYRYTRDDAWVRRIKPKVLKACEFLLAWRNRNKKPELRGKGYGLLDGKVADPEDFFHSFMLNAVSYVGIQRVAEMLTKVDPAASRRLAREAAAFRKDIRTAFYEAMARSPVIPLGDGTWVPSTPPWSEYPGPLALYAEGDNWFTHGAFGARDSLIGTLYLVIGEVLDAREVGATFLLKSHQELFTVKNAGLTQPYYCRHDFIHLKRGETRPYLKTYYNQFTALQDRETYTFWEHYFHASQHKTHEEGWFLMQTRWMLWLEEGNHLAFLKVAPRTWLADGKRLALSNVATYFGPASLAVESRLADGLITATVTCRTNRKPASVSVRLPHPEGRKPVAVTGGTYDPAAETVRIARFTGSARIELRF